MDSAIPSSEFYAYALTITHRTILGWPDRHPQRFFNPTLGRAGTPAPRKESARACNSAESIAASGSLLDHQPPRDLLWFLFVEGHSGELLGNFAGKDVTPSLNFISD